MSFVNWEAMPWEPVTPQISRRVVMRERMMMVMYRFGAGLAWPEESHDAEQAGYIIRGQLELTLPAEGQVVLLGPGDGYHIASMVPHSWRTLGEETLFVDVFSPPRARASSFS